MINRLRSLLTCFTPSHLRKVARDVAIKAASEILLSSHKDAARYPRPTLPQAEKKKNAVITALSSEWGALTLVDAEPMFDLITYSYDDSEATERETSMDGWTKHVRFHSDCFGKSFKNLIPHVLGSYDYVLFLSSDVFMQYSDINKLFHLANLYQLDICQPSISRNSFNSHDHLLHNPFVHIENVPHIEPVAPCFSKSIVRELFKIDCFPQSGWGIGMVILEEIRNSLNLKPSAVVHAVQATHCKIVETCSMTFPNGMTAQQELTELRRAYAKKK